MDTERLSLRWYTQDRDDPPHPYGLCVVLDGEVLGYVTNISMDYHAGKPSTESKLRLTVLDKKTPEHQAKLATLRSFSMVELYTIPMDALK